MARRFRRERSHLSSVSEIDITPLIDLAFSLLIIFMISTPLLEQTVPLNLPLESPRAQATPPEKQEQQVLSIDSTAKIFWGKEPITRTELAQRLQKLSTSPKPPVIHLRADESLPYGQVMGVVDMIKGAQLSQISLDTRASG